jgi:hypothetical protein
VMKRLEVFDYLAASALVSAGARFLGAEPPANGSGKCALLFDDTEGDASRLLREHQAGALRVVSRDYAGAIHQVKDSIFGVRR